MGQQKARILREPTRRRPRLAAGPWSSWRWGSQLAVRGQPHPRWPTPPGNHHQPPCQRPASRHAVPAPARPPKLAGSVRRFLRPGEGADGSGQAGPSRLPQLGGQPGRGRLPHGLRAGRDAAAPTRRPALTRSRTCSPSPAVYAATVSRTSPTPTARAISTSPAPGSTVISSPQPSSRPPGPASPPHTAPFTFRHRAAGQAGSANEATHRWLRQLRPGRGGPPQEGAALGRTRMGSR